MVNGVAHHVALVVVVPPPQAEASVAATIEFAFGSFRNLVDSVWTSDRRAKAASFWRYQSRAVRMPGMRCSRNECRSCASIAGGNRIADNLDTGILSLYMVVVTVTSPCCSIVVAILVASYLDSQSA